MPDLPVQDLYQQDAQDTHLHVEVQAALARCSTGDRSFHRLPDRADNTSPSSGGVTPSTSP